MTSATATREVLKKRETRERERERQERTSERTPSFFIVFRVFFFFLFLSFLCQKRKTKVCFYFERMERVLVQSSSAATSSSLRRRESSRFSSASASSSRTTRRREQRLACRRRRRREREREGQESLTWVTQATGGGNGGALFEEDGTQENGGQDGTSSFPDDLSVPTTCMAQLSGSGGATMQKSKLNLTQEVRISQPKTDDAGGGGDIGNRIFNGGGGDGDDSDDDEYQDDFGDDEEGDPKVGLFDIRDALPELFDKATMECVLSEWYKTVVSLPAGLRMAVEMSVISSAQLVRFLSMDYRPQLTRSLTRALPTEPSRHFVGRLMGDPTFISKLGLEQFLTITGSVLCELKVRGKDRFQKEWKQVVANTTALCMGNAAMMWMTAPSRAFGGGKALLPNNVFDRSGPLRRYGMMDRGQSLLLRTGQMGLVGMAVGAVRQGEEEKKGGWWKMGVHMGLSSWAYQGICGVDRLLSTGCCHLGAVLGGTAILRAANQALVSTTRTLVCSGKNLFSFGKGKPRRKRQQRKKRSGSAFSAATATAMKARASV